MKDTSDKIQMNKERKAIMRNNIIKKGIARKRIQKMWRIPLAAILAALILVLAIPYTRERIVYAATSIKRYFMANGKFFEIGDDAETGAKQYRFDPNIINGTGINLARVRDGRLYMVIGDEWIDVTDNCSSQSYYRYEIDNGEGIKEVIIIGGIPEDNKYGWLDYVYDSKGNCLVRNEHLPCFESNCDAEWTNEDFEWAVIARHDEGIPCIDPTCPICN